MVRCSIRCAASRPAKCEHLSKLTRDLGSSGYSPDSISSRNKCSSVADYCYHDCCSFRLNMTIMSFLRLPDAIRSGR